MTEDDLSLLWDTYGITDSTHLSLPRLGDRVTSSGHKRVAFYEDFLLGDLRFPLHPFFLSFLSHYRLVPSQLAPNAIWVIFAFIVFCHFHGFVARFSLFRALFILKRYSTDDGWWYISPWPRCLRFDLPSSIKGWKNRFFLASVEDVDWAWSEPNRSQNQNYQVEPANQEVFSQLLSDAVPALDVLLSEQNLFETGISPIRELGEAWISLL